eukprot:824476-Pleurochrysis_carterae.AAC.7
MASHTVVSQVDGRAAESAAAMPGAELDQLKQAETAKQVSAAKTDGLAQPRNTDSTLWHVVKAAFCMVSRVPVSCNRARSVR